MFFSTANQRDDRLQRPLATPSRLTGGARRTLASGDDAGCSIIPARAAGAEMKIARSSSTKPRLSVPRTPAGETGALGAKAAGEQEEARGSRWLLSSASNQRRGRSSPFSADSMFVVRTSPSSGCAPKASEMSRLSRFRQPLARSAGTDRRLPVPQRPRRPPAAAQAGAQGSPSPRTGGSASGGSGRSSP